MLFLPLPFKTLLSLKKYCALNCIDRCRYSLFVGTGMLTIKRTCLRHQLYNFLNFLNFQQFMQKLSFSARQLHARRKLCKPAKYTYMYILNSCANHVTRLLEFAKFSLLKFSQQCKYVQMHGSITGKSGMMMVAGEEGKNMKYNNNNKE